MRVWFKNIASMFGIADAEERSVREVLATAVSRSAIVGLSQSEFEAYPDPDCCILEAVESDSLVLLAVGASRPEIVPGAQFTVAIASVRGFHRGEVTVLSRWIEHNERGQRQRIGYRVSVPPALTHVQRRLTHRVPVAFDLAPIAYLGFPTSDASPRKSQIIDLSETGLRVRVPIEQVYEHGQVLEVDARFSEVIPSFRTSCEVVRVTPVASRAIHVVGLRFCEPMHELSHAIRALDLKRSSRPAA